MRSKLGDFFARASEDHGIAGLQANDVLALLCEFHHQGVDVALSAALALPALANQHALGFAARQFEDLFGHEIIEQDDIGRLQRADGFQCEQFGVARACADECHAARAGVGVVSDRGNQCVE